MERGSLARALSVDRRGVPPDVARRCTSGRSGRGSPTRAGQRLTGCIVGGPEGQRRGVAGSAWSSTYLPGSSRARARASTGRWTVHTLWRRSAAARTTRGYQARCLRLEQRAQVDLVGHGQAHQRRQAGVGNASVLDDAQVVGGDARRLGRPLLRQACVQAQLAKTRAKCLGDTRQSPHGGGPAPNVRPTVLQAFHHSVATWPHLAGKLYTTCRDHSLLPLSLVPCRMWMRRGGGPP